MTSINDIGEDQVLETLLRAEQRIEQTVIDDFATDLIWDFGSWATCTCGHIYAVATGEEASVRDVTSPARIDGVYQAVLFEVAQANGYNVYYEELGYVHSLVSDLTARQREDRDDEDNDAYRVAALELIRNTITTIRSRQDEARKQVAKEVV